MGSTNNGGTKSGSESTVASPKEETSTHSQNLIAIIDPYKDISKDIVIPFLSLIVAIVAIAASFKTSSKYSRRSYIWTTTDNFIKEFYSRPFIEHRIVVSRIRCVIDKGKTDIRSISKGFWPDAHSNEYYQGSEEEAYGLNGHQHLTILIGFYTRLCIALSSGQVDRDQITNAFQFQYRQHASILSRMAIETEREFAERIDEMPSFVEFIYTLDEFFRYSPEIHDNNTSI